MEDTFFIIATCVLLVMLFYLNYITNVKVGHLQTLAVRTAETFSTIDRPITSQLLDEVALLRPQLSDLTKERVQNELILKELQSKINQNQTDVATLLLQKTVFDAQPKETPEVLGQQIEAFNKSLNQSLANLGSILTQTVGVEDSPELQTLQDKFNLLIETELKQQSTKLAELTSNLNAYNFPSKTKEWDEAFQVSAFNSTQIIEAQTKLEKLMDYNQSLRKIITVNASTGELSLNKMALNSGLEFTSKEPAKGQYLLAHNSENPEATYWWRPTQKTDKPKTNPKK